jgi:TrmH family RNA methyltransferase
VIPLASKIRIVLVGTTHPGNIGATARAMKTMGLSQLYLVRPKQFPCAEATARASGADDLLARARVSAHLDHALADCTLVCGASARSRTIAWPALEARACAAAVVSEALQGSVAVVFGPEHSGLSNEDLERCHYLVQIPTDPDYRSLNLAAAVQLVCYEIFLAARGETPPTDAGASLYATADEMERFYHELERALTSSGFLDPSNPRKLMRRLRRLFNRARPDKQEYNILRGMLRALTPAGDGAGPERGPSGTDSAEETE